MKPFKLVLLFLFLFVSTFAFSQGLKSFKLKNGLTVYVWEDDSQAEMFGMVAVKAGSVDDPDEYTGLAHYLEHVLFKGTNQIGALNWAEEMGVYNAILEQYDKRAETIDPSKRNEIDLEINRLTAQQSKMSKQGEFFSLVQSIGGTGVNAGTSYDYTVFYNSFPRSQLAKWLDLYSMRFINPVFRTFQTELETVYEEYNMYEDNPNSRVQQFLMEKSFSGHPYSRPIIGKGEHLKNPRLSKLVEFYNKWYVPGNMALILVGNVKTEEIASLVNQKFSLLAEGAAPQPKTYAIEEIKGKKVVSEKLGLYPQEIMIFNGVPAAHPDATVLEVVANMLSNRNQTGLLDELSINGDVMGASAGINALVDHGRILVNAIPSYIYSQQRFESHKMVEKLLLNQIGKLGNGEVNESFLNTIKENMVREYLRVLESSNGKANLLTEAFVNGYDMDRVLNYPERINAVTLEDVNRVAKQYLNENYLVLQLSEGKTDKKEKIEKPNLPEVPEFSTDKESFYAQRFNKIAVPEIEIDEGSFDDVSIKKVNDKSKLFYYPNEQNDIFTMTIKYGVGEREMPELGMATELMNGAGILSAFEPSAFRDELSKLNGILSYSSDDDFVYVNVEGAESQLIPICNLMTRQILMPKLDEKQLNNVKGQLLQGRRIEKESLDAQQQAMGEYLQFGKRSAYLDRMKESEMIALTINDLTGAFQKATDYAAEIHYVGALSFNEVYQVLSANLPLKASELESVSPQEKPIENYNENLVYFLPNPDASQSRIIIYAAGPLFSADLSAPIYAFNQYFGNGFGSLVLEDIREKNSMAYSANGVFYMPVLENKPTFFSGFVGTQADKTTDALDLYMNLMNAMPLYPDRMDRIRSYIRQSLLVEQPSFRTISRVYENWKRMGFLAPRAQVIVPKINEMGFQDLVDFYDTNLKGKPVAIGIVGNPKEIDFKALEKFGKVKRLSNRDVFN
jgi:predicted Zn-dependent peptidase